MSIFNGERSIYKSIESILNQSFSDFEFLIVDDGSYDNSNQIIRKYAKIDKRIKIIKNKRNIGLTKSLNKAILLSKGDFIARQDVDDISLPNRIKKSMDFLRDNPDFAFCGTDGFRKQNKKENLIDTIEFNNIKKNLIAKNCFIHSSILIRKSFLEKYGNYDESYIYGQDYELWCRLMYKFDLKAKNLKEKLIILNIPSRKFQKASLIKFIIQRINDIRTKVKYIKYSEYKFKCIFASFIKFIEFITFSYISGYFSRVIKKINI